MKPQSLADLSHNLILNTDSYKLSHYVQYPPGTEQVFSYVESRGGVYDRTLFFGLQAILKEYLSVPVTHAMVDYAKAFAAAHGEPFNEAGWRAIVDQHGGRMPVRIRAVPEGLVVPTGNVLMTIENTDAQCAWVTSFLETMLLRVWYPITVATQSWHIRQLIRRFLEETGDAGGLGFKLHDFGARGVSSFESAAIGGMAHLVNFMGSDTISGVLAANAYYDEPMAAYSIPAAEHSTITAWGREQEVEAYRNMLAQFARPGSLVAVVSDSYDIDNAVAAMWGEALRPMLIESGATLVIRPDSGDAPSTTVRLARLLDEKFGSVINDKGYKLLQHVRLIWGDGINIRSIREILANLKFAGYAADNIAFGMGGALLQQLNRDTQKFAMKASAVRVHGVWRDVFKDPATDPGKRSKSGRLTLYRDVGSGEFRTGAIGLAPAEGRWEEVLETVWENGELVREQTFAEIRARAEQAGRSYGADEVQCLLAA